jgi:hypothetical protein
MSLKLEFDNAGKLKTKSMTNVMTSLFQVVNFPFISSNIPDVPACGVYISQVIPYSRVCVQYNDFLDSAAAD